MSIFHNGKEYGATKVINYSASPDYNRGVSVTNIQDGNYQATDNGFLLIELQSQQSNVTKVAVIRSQNPITDNTGTEIASRVIQQFQYSEILIAQVMAREYYKLVIEGAGNPQVLSCMFYPYASTVPIKLTESIGVEQVEGLGELATADDVDLSTQAKGVLQVANGGTGTNDGWGFANFIEFQTLCKKIGFSNGTTLEFIRLLPFGIHIYTGMATNNKGYKHFISDLPANATLEIKTFNEGHVVLRLTRFFGLKEFQYAVKSTISQGNTATGWVLTRNRDGTIPAGLINLPVGFIYIQLRGQSTPDQLFGSSGKWQDISSTYAGEFFRAVGESSASFGSKQNEGLPNITGILTNAVLYKNDASYGSTGAFSHTVNSYGQYGGGSNMNIGNLIFQASRVSGVYGGSIHVTPYNSAIRIWKKIS